MGKHMLEIRIAENHSSEFLRIVIHKYSEYLDKNPDDKKMQIALLASCIVLCSRYMGVKT